MKKINLLLVGILILLTGCTEYTTEAKPWNSPTYYDPAMLYIGGVAVDPSTAPTHSITGTEHTFPNTGAQYFVNANGAFSDASAYAAAAANLTGFPWNPDQQALQYKGASYLTNSVANFRSADSSGAIEVWFKSTSNTAQVLFGTADTSGLGVFFGLSINRAGAGSPYVAQSNGGVTNLVDFGTTSIIDGKWHNVILSSNGTIWSVFVDGVAQTPQAPISGSNTGDWFADTNGAGATARDNITIGVLVRSSISGFYTGDIGVTRIYSRSMDVAEALTNYQRGRKAISSNVTGLVFELPLTQQSGNPVDTVGSLTMTRSGTILPTWLNSDGVFVAQGATAYINGSMTVNVTAPAGTNPIYTLPATSQTIPGVGQTNNWTASQNMTGNKITTLAAPTANGDAVRYENLFLPYATLTSSANQTSGGTTTANNVTFNSNDELYKITHSTSSNTSQVWIQETGAYFITFTAMYDMTLPNQHLEAWLKKNGTNIANTKYDKETDQPNEEQLITIKWTAQLLAGEYIEVSWWSDDAGCELIAQLAATSPTRPASPSVILTINKVSN